MLHHEKALADASYYKSQKLAEANALLYTQEYLQLELMRSIGNATKIYFGPSLHSLYLDFFDLMSKNQQSSLNPKK